LYFYILCVLLHGIDMPLTWIHNLPREEAERLAVELGVTGQGTLDELRKRLKEKWRMVEQFLPPRSTEESVASLGDAGRQGGPGSDVYAQASYAQCKLRGKVVTDLVRNMPILLNTEPESVFGFLARAQEVYDLRLVTDGEFLALLVARTTGRLMQVISDHLRVCSPWEYVRSDILAVFFPPRIREGFVVKYISDRFQTATEDLYQYIMSVEAAAKILDHRVPESDLTRRMVQNIHPRIRSQLVFSSEPKSIKELYSLANQVAEGRAIDQIREGQERRGSTSEVSYNGRIPRPVSMTVGEGSPSVSRVMKCWRCNGMGHLRRDCTAVGSRNQGNGVGARQ
jgi:hypothetical protein